MRNKTEVTATGERAGAKPMLSFGVPVKDGARFLRRLLGSIEAQDLSDFEVVICDNESTDGTEAIAREFQKRDPRFKYFRNESNIGQIENFNRVFEMSNGRYFRWIGADDWLEPSYASRCVAELEAHADAVGVTTLWRYQDDEGNAELVEYTGKRVSSDQVVERISRMLWFLQTNVGADPIYSMLRRSVLEKTRMLPISPWTDRVLALELAIAGPFRHIHECLATRRNAREPVKVRLDRYHAGLKNKKHAERGKFAPRWTMYRELGQTVLQSNLGPAEQAMGTALCGAFCGIHYLRGAKRRAIKVLPLGRTGASDSPVLSKRG